MYIIYFLFQKTVSLTGIFNMLSEVLMFSRMKCEISEYMTNHHHVLRDSLCESSLQRKNK